MLISTQSYMMLALTPSPGRVLGVVGPSPCSIVIISRRQGAAEITARETARKIAVVLQEHPYFGLTVSEIVKLHTM